MPRTTGTFRVSKAGGEDVRAFVPAPLPPAQPPLALDGQLSALHTEALTAVGKLGVAGAMGPSAEWFLYGSVRKEAVVSSEIEGTQATLQDVATFEATRRAQRPDDVRGVCNYVDALSFCRKQIAGPKGLPLSTRLLCEAHKRLMQLGPPAVVAHRPGQLLHLVALEPQRRHDRRPGNCAGPLVKARSELSAGSFGGQFIRTTWYRAWCAARTAASRSLAVLDGYCHKRHPRRG